MQKEKKYDLYLKVLEKQIQERQILVDMRNPADEAFVQDIFGKPAYLENNANFIYPVFTSLSGNKSDRYVKRTFDLSTLSQS